MRVPGGYRLLHKAGCRRLIELRKRRHLKSCDYEVVLALVERMSVTGLVKTSIPRLTREEQMSPTGLAEALRRLERAEVFARSGARNSRNQVWVISPRIAASANPRWQAEHVQAWMHTIERARPVPEPTEKALLGRHTIPVSPLPLPA